MLRHLARIVCLGVGGVAGWAVYVNLQRIFEDWIPLASGAFTLVAVFALLYFPLMRPIADVITDRLEVAVHRGRHIQSGSGLGEIPDIPDTRCAICGASGPTMCDACKAEIERQSRTSTH
jgi:hypothetical protein